jgi:hypothetical protein
MLTHAYAGDGLSFALLCSIQSGGMFTTGGGAAGFPYWMTAAGLPARGLAPASDETVDGVAFPAATGRGAGSVTRAGAPHAQAARLRNPRKVQSLAFISPGCCLGDHTLVKVAGSVSAGKDRASIGRFPFFRSVRSSIRHSSCMNKLTPNLIDEHRSACRSGSTGSAEKTVEVPGTAQVRHPAPWSHRAHAPEPCLRQGRPRHRRGPSSLRALHRSSGPHTHSHLARRPASWQPPLPKGLVTSSSATPTVTWSSSVRTGKARDRLSFCQGTR